MNSKLSGCFEELRASLSRLMTSAEYLPAEEPVLIKNASEVNENYEKNVDLCAIEACAYVTMHKKLFGKRMAFYYRRLNELSVDDLDNVIYDLRHCDQYINFPTSTYNGSVIASLVPEDRAYAEVVANYFDKIESSRYGEGTKGHMRSIVDSKRPFFCQITSYASSHTRTLR